MRPGVALLDQPPAVLAEPVPPLGVAQEQVERLGQGRDITRRRQVAACTVLDEVGDRAERRGDHRQAVCERFDEGDPEGLPTRG